MDMSTWFKSDKPVLALAPMADMTDSAFCQTAREVSGPNFVVFREMANSEAIVRQNERTIEMCRFKEIEKPIVQQLFGSNSETMAEAVRTIESKFEPDGFDINMGCPAKKIISNFNGSALMREPEKSSAIIRATKAVTDKPISVKTRLGWNNPKEILDFSKIIEGAGADLLTVHGRTKVQGYSGQADWQTIGEVKSRLSIPIILNGDVIDGPSAAKALEESGCDGLMIGRGALGNPWIFSEISSYLAEKDWQQPSLDERIDIIIKHAKRHAEAHPGPKPLTSLRAHLVHYFKGVPGSKAWREAVVKVSTVSDLEKTIENLAEKLLSE